MRMLMKFEFPVQKGNDMARAGTMAKTIRAILEQQKPECAYFMAEHGQRGGFLVIDVADPSQIPAFAEPWFLALDASVQFVPVMRPEDLAKAEPAIEAAAEKFGNKP